MDRDLTATSVVLVRATPRIRDPYRPAVAPIASTMPFAGDPRLSGLRAAIERDALVKRDDKMLEQPIIGSEGREQAWLMDLRRVFLQQQHLSTIAEIFCDRFGDHGPLQVGGLETGAVPLLTAIALEARRRGMAINPFWVRKERKHYGLTKLIEGRLNDDPVVIVDDLLNSGGTCEKARVVLERYRVPLRDVFVIVDYATDRGLEWRWRHGIEVQALYHLGEFGLDARGGNMNPEADFEAAWIFSRPKPALYYADTQKSTPAVDDDRIYFGQDDGTFWCLDQRTSAVVWSFEQPDAWGKGFFARPVLWRDRVFCGCYAGILYCFDRNTGTVLWSFRGAEFIGSTVEIAEELGLLFVGLEYEVHGRKGAIAALSLETGDMVWEYPTIAYVHASPLYDRDRQLVLCGTNEELFVALDALTGQCVWRFAIDGDVKQKAVLWADPAGRVQVMFGDTGGAIWALDAQTGERIWRTAAFEQIVSTPLIVEGSASGACQQDTLWVTCTDKFCYILDPASGEIVRRLRMTARMVASPRRVGAKIYLGTHAGLALEVDLQTFATTASVQLPDRVCNDVVHCPATGLYFVCTYDNHVYALIRRPRSEPAGTAELAGNAPAEATSDAAA